MTQPIMLQLRIIIIPQADKIVVHSVMQDAVPSLLLKFFDTGNLRIKYLTFVTIINGMICLMNCFIMEAIIKTTPHKEMRLPN